MCSKLVVPSKALDKLHCSLCNEYLSQLPVYTYPGQGAVCGRCPILDDQNPVRVEVYENIAELLLFPCRHQSQGCLENLLPADIPDHEESCIYRTYFCPSVPLGLCPWQGPSNELLAHFEEKHSIFVLKNAQFELDFISKYNENYLLPVDGELFLLHTKSDSNESMFWCSVRYIGSKRIAEKYTYQISLISGNSSDSYSFLPKQVESDVEVNIDKNKAVEIHAEEVRKALKDPPFILCNILLSKVENEGNNTVIEITDSFRTTVTLDNVDESILNELECPVCSEYMVPPIHQCITGHSICGVCKNDLPKNECPSCRGPIQDTRNFLLEKMTTHISYTCKFRDNGCNFVSSSNEIRQHEAECTFGPYDCPLKDYNCCNWKGKLSEIMEHAQFSHDDNIIDIDIVNVPSDIDELKRTNYEEEDWFLMSEFGKIFRLGFRYANLNYYWSVQLVGPSEESKQFNFELDVIDNSNLNQRIFVRRAVAPFCAIDDSFNDGKLYAKLPLDLLLPLIGAEDLTYKIRIVKA